VVFLKVVWVFKDSNQHEEGIVDARTNAGQAQNTFGNEKNRRQSEYAEEHVAIGLARGHARY
jgi:hypothetical protein